MDLDKVTPESKIRLKIVGLDPSPVFDVKYLSHFGNLPIYKTIKQVYDCFPNSPT